MSLPLSPSIKDDHLSKSYSWTVGIIEIGAHRESGFDGKVECYLFKKNNDFVNISSQIIYYFSFSQIERTLRGKTFYKDQDRIYCEEDYLVSIQIFRLLLYYLNFTMCLLCVVFWFSTVGRKVHRVWSHHFSNRKLYYLFYLLLMICTS